MHTVRSCCCGCTLKTGTLILLWIALVSGSLKLIVSLPKYAQGQVPASVILVDFLIKAVVIGISGAGIYGINKQKPSFLKPYLVLQVIGLVVILIVIVLLPFVGATILNTVSGTHDDGKSVGVGTIALTEFLLLGFEALGYYFFVVVLSYYKELRGELPPSV